MRKTILLVAALWAGVAGAQQVWRCGNSYSQQPCAGGVTLDTTDRPTSGDIAQARQAAKADQQRADALEKARLDQEKKAPRAQVMGAPQAPASAPQSAKKADPSKKDKKKAGPKEPAHFTAVAPKK